MGRLSKRNNANGIGGWFSKCREGATPLNHANPYPSFLVPQVGTDKKKAPEHLFQPGEIKTMLSNVGAILRLVPFKIPCNSKRSYIAKTSQVCPDSFEYTTGAIDFGDGCHRFPQIFTNAPFKDELPIANCVLQPLNGYYRIRFPPAC
jgi:hypothetical protein